MSSSAGPSGSVDAGAVWSKQSFLTGVGRMAGPTAQALLPLCVHTATCHTARSESHTTASWAHQVPIELLES